MPLELSEHTVPCKHCTEITKEHGTEVAVTNGCKKCNYTGHAYRWKVTVDHFPSGSLVHLWYGTEFAGNLLFSKNAWEEFYMQLKDNPLWTLPTSL